MYIIKMIGSEFRYRIHHVLRINIVCRTQDNFRRLKHRIKFLCGEGGR